MWYGRPHPAATERSAGMHGSLRRIRAMVLRHLYVLTSSWPRMLDLVYWPTVQVTLWGFITLYLARQGTGVPHIAAILLSAVLLWDSFFRSQLGVSVSFLEEMWARNLGHLFTSPLRPLELVLSLFAMSFVRSFIGVAGAATLAVPIHGFNIVDALGPGLVLLFGNNLLFGWSLGLLVSGLILRLGLGAEGLAWAVVFLIQPLCAVYYPLDVLPAALQLPALLLPPAHVSEAMRERVTEGGFDVLRFAIALLLNLLWMAVSGTLFLLLFRSARRRGLLLQVGE